MASQQKFPQSYHQQPDPVAYQSGYQAGYDAGFRAGFEAASRSPGSNHQQQQPHEEWQYAPPPGPPPQQPYQYGPQQTQLPGPAPQLPYRPPSAAASAPQIPPRPLHQPHQPSHAPPPPTPSSHPPSYLRPTTPLWRPTPGTTFNYVLSSPPPPSHPFTTFSVWILDLFDTPPATIAAIHAAGSRAVAYFSAGSWEDWRPDREEFLRGLKGKGVLGKELDGWKGERWVDVRDETVRGVLSKRVRLAWKKGFDGLDPDNVDGYDNKNGLGLKKGDAVDVVRWLCKEAHKRGVCCGLKNGGGFVKEVLGDVQWVVVEEAVRYKETEDPKGEDEDSEKCNNEKRVEGRKAEQALKMKKHGWSSIIKNVRLDLWVQID